MIINNAAMIPAPTQRPFQEQWKFDLAKALGYTSANDVDINKATPTMYHLPVDDPFTFLEDTNEVIVWEVDGPEDERGMRHSRLLYPGANTIALKPVRYPLPDGYRLITVTTDDNQQHRIAIHD